MSEIHGRVKDYDLPLIEKAAEILRKKPTEHINVDRLAEVVGMSTTKLKSGFKAVFHTTITQYRMGLCLEKAKELLETTDLTMEQIAYRTGFGCRRSFGRSFTQWFNKSPRKWRQGREEKPVIDEMPRSTLHFEVTLCAN